MDGARSDGKIPQGAGGDASASLLSGPGDCQVCSRDRVIECFMWNIFPIPGQGSVGAIKERGCRLVFVKAGPFPVGLITLVITFLAQRLFVPPRVVAMPGKEDGVKVDEECLVDVHGLKVVEEVSCPWGGRKGERRLSA